MSKDTITVNMNVYDIPIVVEQLNKLEQENTQLKEVIEEVRKHVKAHITEDSEYSLYMEMTKEKYNELLQILDKAKGE